MTSHTEGSVLANQTEKGMNKASFIILVVITTFLMGSSFTIGKVGLAYVSPLLLAGLRFTIAGIFMSGFVILFKRVHPRKITDWLRILLVGFFQTTGVMGGIFLSLRTISSGESSILTFMNPLLVVIFGALILGFKYRLIQWAGVLMGFIGVLVTLGGQLQLQVGTLIALGSAVAWAIATLLINKWGDLLDTWVLTAYQMLFGGILLLIGSVFLEDIRLTLNATSVFIVLWLAIMASIVQFSIWFFLLKKGDPGKTSAFLFLAPFFGVLSGWVLLQEQIGVFRFIGGGLICFGIFLVNWPQPSQNRVSSSYNDGYTR